MIAGPLVDLLINAGRNPGAAYRISYLTACGLVLAGAILLTLLLTRWSPILRQAPHTRRPPPCGGSFQHRLNGKKAGLASDRALGCLGAIQFDMEQGGPYGPKGEQQQIGQRHKEQEAETQVEQ